MNLILTASNFGATAELQIEVIWKIMGALNHGGQNLLTSSVQMITWRPLVVKLIHFKSASTIQDAKESFASSNQSKMIKFSRLKIVYWNYLTHWFFYVKWHSTVCAHSLVSCKCFISCRKNSLKEAQFSVKLHQSFTKKHFCPAFLSQKTLLFLPFYIHINSWIGMCNSLAGPRDIQV